MKQIAFAHQVQAAISGDPILSVLSAEARQELARAAKLFRIEKREALYRAGDPADSGWAVVSGQINVVKRTKKKQNFIVAIIVPGEICGALCLSGKPSMVFDAV
ncbi:MAG: cyclic nucleotide-binding domain-containing protein, partial [Verrucomicrobiota bacterium]|nr:cyclic nucleotide-binding domain-containing protein [Verrucomicrobiota bacterium]